MYGNTAGVIEASATTFLSAESTAMMRGDFVRAALVGIVKELLH